MITIPTENARTEISDDTPRTLLNTPQAAAYLGLAVSTMNKWRCHGGGPEFLKLGRAVRYDRDDLDAFLAQHRATSTASY